MRMSKGGMQGGKEGGTEDGRKEISEHISTTAHCVLYPPYSLQTAYSSLRKISE